MEDAGRTQKRKLQGWGNRGDAFKSRRGENPDEEAEKVGASIMVAAEEGKEKQGSKVKTYMRARNISKYFPAMTP